MSTAVILSAPTGVQATPLLDLLVFRPIRALLGGRVRAIMSGGAPLAPDTHDYLKATDTDIAGRAQTLTFGQFSDFLPISYVQ